MVAEGIQHSTDELMKAMKEEKALIQSAYRNLLRSIKVDLTADDKVNIRKAYEMAVEAHQPQRRKTGEPYILHPIEVARICAEEIGLGATSIICALLHDVVEDTPITNDEIKALFGQKVAQIVDGLTKLDKTVDSDSPQADNFKKVLTTLGDDVRVVLIKMADRLHNMRTLGAMRRDKQLKIAAETSFIYAPLAHRLGLYAIKTEFQDLCMKITDPEPYKQIAKELQQTKRAREEFISGVVAQLTPHLEEMGIKYRIFGRAKSIYSIWNKIKAKNIPIEEINDIYDLFALRIIVDVPRRREKAACWEVYSIVTDVYQSFSDRLKDWITTPKSNGYESLHCTLIGPGRFVEVQIRSERMDEISERGFAAHWKYKGVDTNSVASNAGLNNGQPDVYEKWLVDVRELLDNNSSDPIEFLQDFKTNLYNEEIYISTPNGDLIPLPKGSTGLDFAFAIHTELGSKCTVVKVNGVVKPLHYELQSGDRVEIVTTKNQKPNDSWLKFVKTGKARSKIRQLLKEDMKKQSVQGKENLQRKLEQMKVDFEENIEFLVKYYGFKTRLDFFFAISLEQVNLKEIKRFKIEGNKLVEPEIPKLGREEVKLSDIGSVKKFDTKPRLIINNQPGEQYEYSLATCCNCVPGDEVFAYLTTNSGMRIHRMNCPNAENLQVNYSYRILPAEWVETPNSHFLADMIITGIDTGVGVIQRLSQNISSLGLNIRSFNISGDEGYFEAKVSIVVNNLDQLTLAIRALKKIEGVQSVYRKE
jgi:GTP diphosphokinase / guanosine-3',5'-bis(diphosphate) 3'-diphosphatase